LFWKFWICLQIPANHHESKLEMPEPSTNLTIMISGFRMIQKMNKHNTRNQLPSAMMQESRFYSQLELRVHTKNRAISHSYILKTSSEKIPHIKHQNVQLSTLFRICIILFSEVSRDSIVSQNSESIERPTLSAQNGVINGIESMLQPRVNFRSATPSHASCPKLLSHFFVEITRTLYQKKSQIPNFLLIYIIHGSCCCKQQKVTVEH